jgi:DNA polymerase III epsilon subunit-like protein
MTIHVMVDIETLGLSVDTKIISIGAVIFNAEGIVHKFYSPISSSEESQGNRSITQSTIEFWEKQSIPRPDLITENLLSTVLKQFSDWLPKEKYVIWANGITFDISILSHAYGDNPPWKYNAMRDARTIYQMFAFQKLLKPVNIEAHNALEDSIYQAKYLTTILNHNQLWE